MAGPVLGGTSGGPEFTLTWAELADYARDLGRSGGCIKPIRLKGRLDVIDLATGELRPMYDTRDEPGGVLLKPCGNSRETVGPRPARPPTSATPDSRPRRADRRQRRPKRRAVPNPKGDLAAP